MSADRRVDRAADRPLPRDEARALLDRHAPPDAGWKRHCLQVAKVADRMSTALVEAGRPVDRDALHAQALLHDVGRARTHGPFHGWTGFVLLRAQGFPRAGRGCLTHWLKGREPDEVLASPLFRPGIVAQAYAALGPEGWTLSDSVLSIADSSVRHTTIVSVRSRHRDLLERYGDSTWLRRAEELAHGHAAEVGAALGFPVEELLAPLYGDRRDDG